MTRHKLETANVRLNGKTTKYILPEGKRVVDLKMIDAEDEDVLVTLYSEGARTRYYFEKRGLLGIVQKLKRRGFVESVKHGTNYAYDLSEYGYFCLKNNLV